VIANIAQSFNLNLMAGILVGFLIALNTILLAIEDRRAVMGTIGAIGIRPVALLGGMLGEGAVIGVLGGFLGVPSGFLLGRHLVDSFGQAMLAGSGATAKADFSPDLIVVGAVAGILCGVFAMAGPAVRLVRERPVASMSSAGGIQHAREISTWILPCAAAMMAGAYVLCTMVARGSLPIDAGTNGMTLGMFGLGLVAIWGAPRFAGLSAKLLAVARSDVGRLLNADVRRYALLFALSTAVLAVGAMLAIAAHSMQLLGAKQIAAEKPDRLPNALLIASQSILDQRDGQLADTTVELVKGAAGGRPVSTRWRSMISSGSSSRLVIGMTPGDWYSRALYQPIGVADDFWQGMGNGEIGLSEVAAGRLGATNGATVELPTVHGPKRYRVAGIFRPRVVNDAAVGDIVLVTQDISRSDWAAICDQVAVAFPSADDASAHRDDFIHLGAGLVAYDNTQWRSAATHAIARFMRPLTNAGYVVMVAAGVSVLNVFVLGLVQRKRERAALRAIGILAGQEQAVVIAHAGLLGVVAAVFGGLGGLGLSYLWALDSPVQYGLSIDWAVLELPLRTGAVAVFFLVAAAAVYPVIQARRLESSELLRGA
jgi:putative ABC transport system permease protein